MRPSSLLLLAPFIALSMVGCAGLPRRPDPTAAEVAAEGNSLVGPTPDATAQGGPSASNPGESTIYSSSMQPARETLASALSRPEVQTMITGGALTAVGVLSAVMGGVLLGWGGGACHSNNESCAAGVALPIVGALWIGAGVLPLVLGVSLWVPKTNDPRAPPAPRQTVARPAILVGPGAAGVRWEF